MGIENGGFRQNLVNPPQDCTDDRDSDLEFEKSPACSWSVEASNTAKAGARGHRSRVGAGGHVRASGIEMGVFVRSRSTSIVGHPLVLIRPAPRVAKLNERMLCSAVVPCANLRSEQNQFHTRPPEAKAAGTVIVLPDKLQCPCTWSRETFSFRDHFFFVG